MKKLLIFFSIILSLVVAPITADAQKPTESERKAWMKEMQQYKNDYLAKRLHLTDEQKKPFFDAYNKMDAEIGRVNWDAMKMRRNVRKLGDKATDVEKEKAAEALFEVKGKEAKIEEKYFKEFKKVLTPDQLLKLKDVERDFLRKVMEEHHNHRPNKKHK